MHMSYCKYVHVLFNTNTCPVPNNHMSCWIKTHVLLQTYTCPVAHLHTLLPMRPVHVRRSSCYCQPLTPTPASSHLCSCSVVNLRISCCQHVHVLFQTYTCPVSNLHMFCCKPAHVLLQTCTCPCPSLIPLPPSVHPYARVSVSLQLSCPNPLVNVHMSCFKPTHVLL